ATGLSGGKLSACLADQLTQAKAFPRVAIRLLSSGRATAAVSPPLHRDPELAQLLAELPAWIWQADAGDSGPLLDRIANSRRPRIYAGQLAVLGGTPTGPLIRHMHEQEQDHLGRPSSGVARARPTVLMPFWRVAALRFGAGGGTALIGKEAAMACTLRSLLADNPELHADLMRVIARFRDEEAEHHDTGLREDAESAPAYPALSAAIRAGCRVAIFFSSAVECGAPDRSSSGCVAELVSGLANSDISRKEKHILPIGSARLLRSCQTALKLLRKQLGLDAVPAEVAEKLRSAAVWRIRLPVRLAYLLLVALPAVAHQASRQTRQQPAAQLAFWNALLTQDAYLSRRGSVTPNDDEGPRQQLLH
uniref:PNPLA domain-containing protein n=1 Tax=Macrostomum lignano TaxID=282301 RepID=A0A1I8JPP7_9PLAT